MAATVAQIKLLFFDRRAVMSAVDRGTRKALSYFGGYVRKVARNSMRQAAGPSAPGTPPHVHVGLIKDFTFYAYEPANQNVVIGPAALKSRSPYGDTTVPEVTEYGGWVSRRRKTRVRRGGSKFRVAVIERVQYPARPFMQPAFETAKERLPDMWANSVKP
jgi:hypothetical protein